jgi:acyl-CoA dehydrogenase family protein 9
MRTQSSRRKQFGGPIAEYPLVQEMIGSAEIEERQIWAITALTASLLKNDPLGEVAAESSHTKLYGTTRAWQVLYDALQVAGGSGYLATQPYEKRMRDFRVTTVFEGTTEIHSIYPPLSVMRDLNKELGSKGRLAKFLKLKSLALKPVKIELPQIRGLDRRTVKTAGHEIAWGVKRIRRDIARGMIRFGKNVAEEEFFLRRITRLSVSVYTLIALVCLAAEEQADAAAIGSAIDYTCLQNRRNRLPSRVKSDLEKTALRAFEAGGAGS